MGEPINWLVPHKFTQTLPKEVDIRVMLTFLEFYEVFLKFVLFKLYVSQGMQYPPLVDNRLDEAGCCLLAVRTLPLLDGGGAYGYLHYWTIVTHCEPNQSIHR